MKPIRGYPEAHTGAPFQRNCREKTQKTQNGFGGILSRSYFPRSLRFFVAILPH
jgi:hypothetical protein